MERIIRPSEKLLLFGYTLILVFMIVQDLIPLGNLNDIKAIASVHSTNEIIFITLIGVVQILLLIGGILFFIGKKYPIWVRIWLIIHPAFIFIGALFSWWIPYLFGIGAEEKMEIYNTMFGNTHAFLPEMNGIVPNTLHTIFHSTLFACILITIYICLTMQDKKKGVID
ncbi:hypothetical protein SPD48_10335 [Pseudogracilibacillus sp. SE30717A]|uniref:hypothetical protein n=1 Tax=Pseudogracilibacillus sp. SE30717A TaxID=3098293 RepID=UPI00300E097F